MGEKGVSKTRKLMIAVDVDVDDDGRPPHLLCRVICYFVFSQQPKVRQRGA
jgi:hypothetical protein